jgi:hypothetical protein
MMAKARTKSGGDIQWTCGNCEEVKSGFGDMESAAEDASSHHKDTHLEYGYAPSFSYQDLNAPVDSSDD